MELESGECGRRLTHIVAQITPKLRLDNTALSRRSCRLYIICRQGYEKKSTPTSLRIVGMGNTALRHFIWRNPLLI
jgi:hypothetical protein